MGYMGFGMRKEVYTRKPKTAFKKVKKMYGEKPVFPKSKVKPSTSGKIRAYRWERFQHAGDTVFFKLFVFVALVAGVLIIMRVAGIL